MSTKPLFDSEKVSQAISVLVEPGNVFEIRCLEANTYDYQSKRTIAGYFDNPKDAVEALAPLKLAKGIYFTLNPIIPDMLAIRYNRLDTAGKGEATADQHIQKRRWLLVDCDPKRVSPYISSTDDELNKAVQKADEIKSYLTSVGFPDCVEAVSGNGKHLLYRIDLPSDDGKLVEKVLKALGQKFSDNAVGVDEGVFNPARICKLYGTLACKGDDTPQRPHRLSELTHVPESIEVVSREMLEKVAALYVEPQPPVLPSGAKAKKTPAPKSSGVNPVLSGSGFDVGKFLEKHSVTVKSKHQNNGMTILELEQCPFNPDHGGHGEVAVFVQGDGKLGFKCHHSSCSDNHWKEFRQHFEPDASDGNIKAVKPDALKSVLASELPTIELPGAERLVSEFGSDLATHFADKNLFIRNGEIVVLREGELKSMKPAEFRTWVEQYVTCYRHEWRNKNSYEIGITMSHDNATAVLACQQFLEKLRPIKQVNDCRLPIMREGGAIELLPDGYDADSQTLTIPAFDYAMDVPLTDAVAGIEDLFSEFTWADGERSKSVAMAAMVGLYAKHLLPPLTLRPCFIFVANAEGAGKSMLVSVVTTPTLGKIPTGRKAGDDDEIGKLLLATVKEARPVLFLDNLKGFLSSESLEAFLSAPSYEGRKLGFNEYTSGENLATLFITGNGLTVSPDMRRRSLFVELRLEVERAEDREFKRRLDMPALLEMRPKILGALWSLVRNWNEKGKPTPSRGNSSFTSWANIIGGIVEAVGFGCPLDTAEVARVADVDTDDMRRLTAAMEDGRRYEFAELIGLARKQECFSGIIGDGDLERKEKARLGRLFQRYHQRLVGEKRFVIEGQGHSRRFSVEVLNAKVEPVAVHGRMVGHGVPTIKPFPIESFFGLETMLDHAPCRVFEGALAFINN